jgi:hypothetical protein
MDLNEDVIIAAVRLAERCGANDFDIGFTDEDAATSEEAGWWAQVSFHGARLFVDNRRSPEEAAMALAQLILRDATCRCTRTVTLSRPAKAGGRWCRWRLVGNQWVPGCDVPPVPVDKRGDPAALDRAMQERIEGKR